MKILVNTQAEKDMIIRHSAELEGFNLKHHNTFTDIHHHPEMIEIVEDISIGQGLEWSEEKLKTVESFIKEQSKKRTPAQIKSNELNGVRYEIEDMFADWNITRSFTLPLIEEGLKVFKTSENLFDWLYSISSIIKNKRMYEWRDEELIEFLKTNTDLS